MRKDRAMSIEKDILRALKGSAKSEKQLKTATGVGGKKLGKALKVLKGQQRIVVRGGKYTLSVQEAVRTRKPKPRSTEGIASKIVKLGRNFGFAQPLDGSGDIFIPGHALLGAMPGDEVAVHLYAHPRVEGTREGEVVAVTAPNNRLVGTVENREGRLYLLPDNAPEVPIAIKRKGEGGAAHGDKVAGTLVERGNGHALHRAEVVLRFGSADSAQECAKAILYAAGIEKAFPEEAKAQAKRLALTEITPEAEAQREDLRDQIIFTIDSDSTKDIDDAISARRVGKGYELGVHIADVSYFVQPHTPLDKDAFHRGTSVYYADSVIPMLPKQLSNGICSLNPGEDRLAFSCIMQLDANGKMTEYTFAKSVIRSRVKGVYAEINKLFAGSKAKALTAKYKEVSETLSIMREIYEKLTVLRQQRGCMEIESEEPYLLIDENGKCVGVEKRSRGDAERLIEECMLLANTAAATLARSMEIPFVYRVHEKPMEDKAAALKTMLTAAGVPYKFKADIPTQKELGKLLDDSRGTPLEKFVHNAVLRSMAKAKYEPMPKGHYGLALADYAHFTSPIRRYPDLAIHRILTDVVQDMPRAELKKKYKVFVQNASTRSSETELAAQKAERDIDSCYKAEYMRLFMGQEFDGVIGSVMQFGIYVELPNTVEGLIHISRLPEEHLDLVEGVSLTNPLTGIGYRIGDGIRVKLVGVDIARGNIDFDLVAHTAASAKTRVDLEPAKG